MEKIQVNDESGDRKYFTIIPNYILNHSTATAQALYLQLKRLAGDNGTTFAASTYLRKQLGISQPTLRKEMKYLLDKKWISFVGLKLVQTTGGMQQIKCYRVVDLWELNNQYYQKQRGEKLDTPLEQRGEKNVSKGVKESATKKNQEKKKEFSYENRSRYGELRAGMTDAEIRRLVQ
jgi:bisphosphoglycerate-dependent phosphoglycerate mutase